MTLTRDGLATLEWIERYLERVRELPVLAQVEPGEIRASLPSLPPEHGEPFASVLRDLDDVLLGGKGDDTINGKRGVDTCRGGGGQDTISNCERS